MRATEEKTRKPSPQQQQAKGVGDNLYSNLPITNPYINASHPTKTDYPKQIICSTCPDDENFEGQQFTKEDGKSFVFSSDKWVPGSEYESFLLSQVNGETQMLYFDYYAGKHGYDPTREDWDISSFWWNYASEKGFRTSIWKNLYNNDVADDFMTHYAYGNGAEYELSKDDFLASVGIRQEIGIRDFTQGQSAISKVIAMGRSPNDSWKSASVSFEGEKQVYAVHAGTLGNYSIKISGYLYLISPVTWAFHGTININDTYDFNVSEHRPPSDEANVTTARHHLWGKPFNIKGTYSISQYAGTESFNIFDNMNRENIISNYHSFKKYFADRYGVKW